MITEVSWDTYDLVMFKGTGLRREGDDLREHPVCYHFQGRFYKRMRIIKKIFMCDTYNEIQQLNSQSRNSIYGFIVSHNRKCKLERI